MPSYPSRLGNTSTNISDLESGRVPFLTPITKQTYFPEIVHQFYDGDSHSSTSTREEFIQDIIIENIYIEEEETNHLTLRAMRISGSIQENSVLADPLLVATNKSYFSKSTGSTEINFWADKVISPKNLQGTPGTRQHGTHLSGSTKAFILLFVAAIFFANSQTGESNTKNETKNMSIQEAFIGNTLKCKKLNKLFVDLRYGRLHEDIDFKVS